IDAEVHADASFGSMNSGRSGLICPAVSPTNYQGAAPRPGRCIATWSPAMHRRKILDSGKRTTLLSLHPSQPAFTCGTDHWATAIGLSTGEPRNGADRQ